MRTLIIGDVHDETERVEAILTAESWDRAVFLGDWFDSFRGGARRARRTAVFLRSILDEPAFSFLLGNHDAHYLWPAATGLRCSGFSRSKMDEVTAALRPVSLCRRRFRLFTVADGWLLSHAGVTRNLVPEERRDSPESVTAWLEEASRGALLSLARGWVPALLDAGPERGGNGACGGIDWVDFEWLDPVPGFRQVVGHTAGREVRYAANSSGCAVCLDTGLDHYAVLEEGRLAVYRSPR